MSRFACASLVALAAASDGGDYSKYMSGGGQGGDYQKYMKKYAKGQGGSDSGGGGDYSKYMKGQGGDYSKYMSGGQGGAKVDAVSMAASACTTMDCLDTWHEKQKKQMNYIPQAYQAKPLKKIEDTFDENKARIQKGVPVVLDAAVAVATDASSVKVDEPVALFAEPKGISAKAISLAAKCTTMECLEAWRTSQEKEISKYVPKDYQAKATKNIEAHFEKMKTSIQGGLPVSLASDASMTKTSADAVTTASDASVTTAADTVATASDATGLSAAAILLADTCTTVECLDAWREKQEKEIKKYVPKEYQAKASKNIVAHFEKSKARIENGGVSPVALAAEVTEPVVLTAEVINLAAACTTMECLDEWKEKQQKRVGKYVPKEWSAKAMKDIETHYEKQQARIQNGGPLAMSTESSTMSPAMLCIAAGVPSFGAGVLLMFAMRRRGGAQDEDASAYQTVV